MAIKYYDFWTVPEQEHFGRRYMTPKQASAYAKEFQLTYKEVE